MWRAHVHPLGFLTHALGDALFSRGQLSWMWMVHHVRKWVSHHPHQTEAGAAAAAQALDSFHSQLLLPRRSLVVRLTPTRQPDSKCLRVVTFHWKLFGNASVCLAQVSQVLACYIIQSKVLQTTQQDKLGCGFPQWPVLDTAALPLEESCRCLKELAFWMRLNFYDVLSEHSVISEHSSHNQILVFSSLAIKEKNLGWLRMDGLLWFLQRATEDWSWWKSILPVIIQSTAKWCVDINPLCRLVVRLDFNHSQNSMGDLIIWGGPEAMLGGKLNNNLISVGWGIKGINR